MKWICSSRSQRGQRIDHTGTRQAWLKSIALLGYLSWLSHARDNGSKRLLSNLMKIMLPFLSDASHFEEDDWFLMVFLSDANLSRDIVVVRRQLVDTSHLVIFSWNSFPFSVWRDSQVDAVSSMNHSTLTEIFHFLRIHRCSYSPLSSSVDALTFDNTTSQTD